MNDKDKLDLCENVMSSAKETARKELAEEAFREEVDNYKTKLRRVRWWHYVLPWKIIIVRRYL